MQQKPCNLIADKLKDMDENKDQDRQLFSQIAIDVREHPNRYSRAGKWLDKYCGEKHQVSRLVRFNETRHYWLDKYEEQSFISKDDARCIILITWLLTDPDAEKNNLNITKCVRWSWKPTDDIFSDSRCAASLLWQQNSNAYRLWMRLVRIAWKTVETQKQAETERNTTPAKRWNIWTWLKGVIKEAYRITMRSFFDSAMHK